MEEEAGHDHPALRAMIMALEGISSGRAYAPQHRNYTELRETTVTVDSRLAEHATHGAHPAAHTVSSGGAPNLSTISPTLAPTFHMPAFHM